MDGIARNPIYIGRSVYGKTQSRLIRSTGKKKVSRGEAADQVIVELPHLRIVSDELWYAVQEQLVENSARATGDGKRTPVRARRPAYLLTGLTKCGCCGGGYTMLGYRLGCDGRARGLCTNGRRVGREDVEDVVLTGLKERLLQPHVMDTYVDEYRREVEKAVAEQADRSASVTASLSEMEKQIANLIQAVKTAGSDSYAARLLNEELEKLGAQREQLKRTASRVASPISIPRSSEAVIERLRALLDDLGEALNGSERDAARARGIIRSLISQVVITPLEGEGKPDGRGAGPVRVTVEGPLRELLGLASFDREIKSRKSGVTTFGLPTSTFRYYVDIPWADASIRETTFADMAVFSQMLDDADAPVTRAQLREALSRGAQSSSEDQLPQRVDRLMAYFSSRGRIRGVRDRKKVIGWVWSDSQIDDEEWVRRAKEKRSPPMAVARWTAPEAFVVVVTPEAESEEE